MAGSLVCVCRTAKGWEAMVNGVWGQVQKRRQVQKQILRLGEG